MYYIALNLIFKKKSSEYTGLLKMTQTTRRRNSSQERGDGNGKHVAGFQKYQDHLLCQQHFCHSQNQLEPAG